jgi:hypothetical protein
MYATDTGSSPKIMRIGLDGTNMEVLVKKDIEQPACITIGMVINCYYYSIQQSS